MLVTGGSGFLGSFCIIALLNAGYSVRTTVRDLSRSSGLLDIFRKSDRVESSSLDRLSFVATDLTKDERWEHAVSGCTYILHVASPFPDHQPKHEDDLIIPAREGSLRVLRAARAAGVKRVVLTSSLAAVSFGHPEQSAPFTEESWTNVSGKDVTAYAKSKTLAEKAAWEFVKSPEGKGLELSVINPVGIFGPVLSADYATSIIIIQRLLNGDVPGCPDLTVSVVDVRDVASLHLLAMTNPAAAGERFIAISPPTMSFRDVALTLKEKVPQWSERTPTRGVPNFLLRIIALFDRQVATIIPQLGKKYDATSEKAQRVLGWQARSREDAIVATAESLVKLGLIKNV